VEKQHGRNTIQPTFSVQENVHSYLKKQSPNCQSQSPNIFMRARIVAKSLRGGSIVNIVASIALTGQIMKNQINIIIKSPKERVLYAEKNSLIYLGRNGGDSAQRIVIKNMVNLFAHINIGYQSARQENAARTH